MQLEGANTEVQIAWNICSQMKESSEDYEQERHRQSEFYHKVSTTHSSVKDDLFLRNQEVFLRIVEPNQKMMVEPLWGYLLPHSA